MLSIPRVAVETTVLWEERAWQEGRGFGRSKVTVKEHGLKLSQERSIDDPIGANVSATLFMPVCWKAWKLNRFTAVPVMPDITSQLLIAVLSILSEYLLRQWG